MEEQLENVIIAGGNDDDVEAVILLNIIGRGPREFEPTDEFDLANLQDDECKVLFRFENNDIYRLSEALRIPDFIRTYKGNKVTGVTALCMVLRRLVYPNRLSDIKLFGASSQSMSLVINTTIKFIYDNYSHLISNLQHLRWLNEQRMDLYAQVVQERGAAIPNCWGFIDGTARAICKPSFQQEQYYSGHKRFHCLKYQSVLCPDGIIASLKGAWPGRRHDAAMFAESNLYEELERLAVFPNGRKFVLFGDQAYGIRELLLTPYTDRVNLGQQQRLFNVSMKPLRTAVEWGFQKVLSEFAFLDFKKNQKLLLQDLELMYKTSCILANCHTAMYGSQTSVFFNINPPTLEEYLG